jgi:long-subunit acyl-CoA synthetase (AMP-forming)
MKNLGQFLREYSREHNGRSAYEMKRGFRTEKWSFADVYSLSLKTATFLKNCTLKKGDTIAIWSPNMPEYPICALQHKCEKIENSILYAKKSTMACSNSLLYPRNGYTGFAGSFTDSKSFFSSHP